MSSRPFYLLVSSLPPTAYVPLSFLLSLLYLIPNPYLSLSLSILLISLIFL